MTVRQHMREGNSLKPAKLCSLKNRLWLLKYAGRPTPNNEKSWSKKTAIDPQNKGERWERERNLEKCLHGSLEEQNMD